jgi:hypothetical protein
LGKNRKRNVTVQRTSYQLSALVTIVLALSKDDKPNDIIGLLTKQTVMFQADLLTADRVKC